MKGLGKHWITGIIVVLGLIGIGLASPVTAQAKAKANFPRKTITYHISSTGSYYRGVWKLAVKNWNHLKVVKLVETSDASAANLVLTTTKTAGKNYAYTSSMSYPTVKDSDSENSSSISTQYFNYKILLSRKMMKWFYFNKTERAGWGSTAIGDILGLNTSKNFESVMNFSSFKEDKPTKYDKKNLKKLYQNLPY